MSLPNERTFVRTFETAPMMSGLQCSPDLKARVVDFMERAEELLDHELAGYNPPIINGFRDAQTGALTITGLKEDLLPKKQLVYFATIERPILWTEIEPIFVSKLVSSLWQEHPALRPVCAEISADFKEWRNKLFIGLHEGPLPEGVEPEEDYQLIAAYTAPVGTSLPDEIAAQGIVQDTYYAKVYLNGFVWHNDSD